jgi:hypothetical protein
MVGVPFRLQGYCALHNAQNIGVCYAGVKESFAMQQF